MLRKKLLAVALVAAFGACDSGAMDAQEPGGDDSADIGIAAGASIDSIARLSVSDLEKAFEAGLAAGAAVELQGSPNVVYVDGGGFQIFSRLAAQLMLSTGLSFESGSVGHSQMAALSGSVGAGGEAQLGVGPFQLGLQAVGVAGGSVAIAKVTNPIDPFDNTVGFLLVDTGAAAGFGVGVDLGDLGSAEVGATGAVQGRLLCVGPAIDCSLDNAVAGAGAVGFEIGDLVEFRTESAAGVATNAVVKLNPTPGQKELGFNTAVLAGGDFSTFIRIGNAEFRLDFDITALTDLGAGISEAGLNFGALGLIDANLGVELGIQ